MLRLFARHPVAFCGMLLLDVWSCCERKVCRGANGHNMPPNIVGPTMLGGQQCWELLHPFARGYKTKALIRLSQLLKAVFF